MQKERNWRIKKDINILYKKALKDAVSVQKIHRPSHQRTAVLLPIHLKLDHNLIPAWNALLESMPTLTRESFTYRKHQPHRSACSTCRSGKEEGSCCRRHRSTVRTLGQLRSCGSLLSQYGSDLRYGATCRGSWCRKQRYHLGSSSWCTGPIEGQCRTGPGTCSCRCHRSRPKHCR
jgi:hypothetical protein